MKKLAAIAIALLTNYGASAQQSDVGAIAFRWNCSPCHGLDGKGDGLPPDLTTLEKKNGGKFPAERVYEIVQETWIGTNIHRRMPVMGFDVRSRSSTIVNYLRRIQEK
jgi:mono/diheme cytochrome c family protein